MRPNDHRKKIILILDDRPMEREILEGTLADRGFWVLTAGTVEEARALVEQFGDRLDVLLLDMVLEGATLGAEFGLEVRAKRLNNLPEFIIHSAYDEPRYTQLAFRLGVRAYLRKPETSLKEIVRHVRVLALTKALRPEHPDRLRQIEEIADRSPSKEEAFAAFCEEVLRPELEATLGAPYVLLASQSGSTRAFTSGIELPETSPAYGILQDLVQLSPWVVDPEQIPETVRPEDRDAVGELLGRLAGTAFIPLGAVDDLNDLRLSLGIVQVRKDQKFVEDALELAKLIQHFVSPAVVSFLIKLTGKFHEVLARQRAVLDSTAKICLYIGQEQISLFERALETEVLTHDDLSSDLGKMLSLGENLRWAGELLAAVATPDVNREAAGRASSIAQVVRRAWKGLTREIPHLDEDLLSLDGDCAVQGGPENLEIAVARMLSWMAKHAVEYPTEAAQSISVECRQDPEPRVVFRDNSRRLPPTLRTKLFAPFSSPRLEDPESQRGQGEILGPYLAKALVELQYDGFLEDRTDDLEGANGHCFVMRLRRPANTDRPLGWVHYA